MHGANPNDWNKDCACKKCSCQNKTRMSDQALAGYIHGMIKFAHNIWTKRVEDLDKDKHHYTQSFYWHTQGKIDELRRAIGWLENMLEVYDEQDR